VHVCLRGFLFQTDPTDLLYFEKNSWDFDIDAFSCNNHKTLNNFIKKSVYL
jgi:hypothetical protein